MALVDQIAKALSARDQRRAELLADEYWTPTQEWRFWEYLSKEMKGLGSEPWPDMIRMVTAGAAYDADRNECAAFVARKAERKA